MIASILGDEETGGTGEGGEGGGPGLDIGMDTSLGDDLMLESIDMVALSERLEERYGERVNFAEMIAGMELDELIELTVGRLVDHVVLSLAPAAER
ncbi:acyl carrier protein [Streptomyces marincola]|nr:acyl carrier protein [Streptomyces marincola]